MRLKKGENNRLLIYFFYDRDGVVDDYILYMLDKMKECVKDVIIVSNGRISDEGKGNFARYSNTVIERNNVGFDVGAYKEALESVGWEQLAVYDEVILMNYTIMGPIYPLQEMFNVMDERDLDFWGPTMSHAVDDDPWGTSPYGYLPDHIQSHFIVVRRSLIFTKEFREYWTNMPLIQDYQQSVGRHETYFTKYFADLGHKWSVYVDSEEYRSLTTQPILMMAKEMIEDKRCPFFKRRSFMHDYTVVLNESMGQSTIRLYQYLLNHTDYDVNLIWGNILRVENQADIKKNMQLNYIVPSNTLLKSENMPQYKVALIMHVYFEDLIPECVYYASMMPTYADIYITTNTDEKKRAIENSFTIVQCNKLDVRVVPNRGRDVGPFLVESREYINDYDIICHTHDKKVGQLKPGTVGQSFSHRCFENVLRSQEQVINILQTFADNPRLGILMPPPPNHGAYFITLGMEWGLNYENTCRLAEKLGIHVNMDEKKEPIAPLGSVFWARTDALKKVFDYPWTYEELPEEPIDDDGTILHAVERIYSYSAQSCGYYPGWVFSEYGAEMEMTNIYYMLRGLNTTLIDKGHIAGPYHKVISDLEILAGAGNTMDGNPAVLEGGLYYAYNGAEYSEKQLVKERVLTENDEFVYEYDLSNNDKSISALRFDPGEQGGIVVKHMEMVVYTCDGSKEIYSLADFVTNGLIKDGEIIFLENDPWITVEIPPGKLKNVVVRISVERGLNHDLAQQLYAGMMENEHQGLGHKIRRAISRK